MTVSKHIVQLFDSVETRIESVAGVLADASRGGRTIFAIARQAHHSPIVTRMREIGAAVDRPSATDRLVLFDARDTLAQLCRRGTPDAALFEKVIGEPIRRASRDHRVCAYGEMGDLLAERGDFADTILLEAYWNRLADRAPLSLLCGYSAAHFVADGGQRALTRICAAHTGTCALPHDPLAAWLVNAK